MGTSFTLYECDPIELSLEVDKDISLEMSTGFKVGTRSQAIVMMPCQIENLTDIINALTEIRDYLLVSWKCPECNTINSKDWTTCNNCDHKPAFPMQGDC